MTGHNHHPDCTCRWCVGGWRNHDTRSLAAIGRSRLLQSVHWPGTQARYESYVNPNARCPVCGASVFFYQSPYGGRVFFDEMGPPWPKHPCTDNPERSRWRPPSDQYPLVKVATAPAWKRDGWIPLVIIQVKNLDNWTYISGIRQDNKENLSGIMPNIGNIISGIPAFVKPFDSIGLGQITLVPGSESLLTPTPPIIFCQSIYLPCNASDVDRAKSGDVFASSKVGYKMSFGWNSFDHTIFNSNIFPSLIPWSVVTKWIEKGIQEKNPIAVNCLALMHEGGFGVTQDYKKCFQLFSQAAEDLLPDALLNLYRCYFFGIGTDRDEAAANAFLEMAREAEDLE